MIYLYYLDYMYCFYKYEIVEIDNVYNIYVWNKTYGFIVDYIIYRYWGFSFFEFLFDFYR